MEELDFLTNPDEALDAPDEEKLKTIADLANRQLRWELRVQQLTEELKEATDQLRKVQEQDLPDALLACGVAGFRLADGTEIEVNEDLYANISEARREKAFAWLREHGHGSIIKNVVEASFGKGQDADAQALLDALREQGFDVRQKESVHGGTLKAWAKEQDRNGEELDEELFGIHRARKAKILRPAE